MFTEAKKVAITEHQLRKLAVSIVEQEEKAGSNYVIVDLDAIKKLIKTAGLFWYIDNNYDFFDYDDASRIDNTEYHELNESDFEPEDEENKSYIQTADGFTVEATEIKQKGAAVRKEQENFSRQEYDH